MAAPMKSLPAMEVTNTMEEYIADTCKSMCTSIFKHKVKVLISAMMMYS